MERSLKEQERTERSERKRTRCPTLPKLHKKGKRCLSRCDEPKPHELEMYKYFLDLSAPRRWGICKMEDRCLSCLNTGHALRDCKKGKKNAQTPGFFAAAV